MQDWLEKSKLGNQQKAINFGTAPAMNWGNQAGGVNYANATAGSQTYQASSLVNR